MRVRAAEFSCANKALSIFVRLRVLATAPDASSGQRSQHTGAVQEISSTGMQFSVSPVYVGRGFEEGFPSRIFCLVLTRDREHDIA